MPKWPSLCQGSYHPPLPVTQPWRTALCTLTHWEGRERRVKETGGGENGPFFVLHTHNLAHTHTHRHFVEAMAALQSVAGNAEAFCTFSRPKRQAKPGSEDGFWDCSVCTFRNSAEAFKCSICDVRKGTSTRKPRINSQLVAQQVAQQYATPPPPKKEKKEKVEKDKPDKEKEVSSNASKKNSNKKIKPKMELEKGPPSEINSIQSGKATTKTDSLHTSRPKLKNIDRSTAQQLAVTVGNVTVIITDFKEKIRSSSTSSSTVTSSAGSEQQNQSSSGSESTDKGSSRSSTPKGEMSAVNDESF
ncbi:RING1 and YY1-binding protein B isoform X2 [Mobula birostris]|uniref:RING1 and YY1-binding protein B isoform X2 n=1 Tax=Mobula birostris TaxID=1983395 RepID=UPI003B27CD08